MKMKTANEILEEFGIEHKNADIIIDEVIQNTIVYTLCDVNKIITKLEKRKKYRIVKKGG